MIVRPTWNTTMLFLRSLIDKRCARFEEKQVAIQSKYESWKRNELRIVTALRCVISRLAIVFAFRMTWLRRTLQATPKNILIIHLISFLSSSLLAHSRKCLSAESAFACVESITCVNTLLIIWGQDETKNRCRHLDVHIARVHGMRFWFYNRKLMFIFHWWFVLLSCLDLVRAVSFTQDDNERSVYTGDDKAVLQ